MTTTVALCGALWLAAAGSRAVGPEPFLLADLPKAAAAAAERLVDGERLCPAAPSAIAAPVGIDIGLNCDEIAKALGVRDDTWWGLPLRFFVSYYRLEYTAWGFRYDLNHNHRLGFGPAGGSIRAR
ncbi:MAG: hypothetical protein ABI682_07795 [Acidobacteriota bacterium]